MVLERCRQGSGPERIASVGYEAGVKIYVERALVEDREEFEQDKELRRRWPVFWSFAHCEDLSSTFQEYRVRGHDKMWGGVRSSGLAGATLNLGSTEMYRNEPTGIRLHRILTTTGSAEIPFL